MSHPLDALEHVMPGIKRCFLVVWSAGLLLGCGYQTESEAETLSKAALLRQEFERCGIIAWESADGSGRICVASIWEPQDRQVCRMLRAANIDCAGGWAHRTCYLESNLEDAPLTIRLLRELRVRYGIKDMWIAGDPK
jgi:hypothetical protein